MSAEAMNFDDVVQELLNDRLCGPHDVAIWGGQFGMEQLDRFMQVWVLDGLPYRIWEYPDRIAFQRGSLPVVDNVIHLDRGRLFGSGGDLSLRRDGMSYRWHFVGAPETAQPEGFSLSN